MSEAVPMLHLFRRWRNQLVSEPSHWTAATLTRQLLMSVLKKRMHLWKSFKLPIDDVTSAHQSIDQSVDKTKNNNTCDPPGHYRGCLCMLRWVSEPSHWTAVLVQLTTQRTTTRSTMSTHLCQAPFMENMRLEISGAAYACFTGFPNPLIGPRLPWRWRYL